YHAEVRAPRRRIRSTPDNRSASLIPRWASDVPPSSSLLRTEVMAHTPVSPPGHPGPFERFSAIPAAQGMYNPRFEKDACGLAMVATLRGTAGHDIVTQALDALRHLEHRGAIGSDAGTGDGAGIITQIPDAFLRAVVGFDLPPVGRYAVGMAFLPTDKAERDEQKAAIERIADEESLRVLGWRDVPTDPAHLGALAREAAPVFEQLFVEATRGDEKGAPLAGIQLDRLTFRLRKRAERELGAYFPSLSAR